MSRIANVNIPKNKRLFIALTYIYGIGRTFAGQICDIAKVDMFTKVSDLKDNQLDALREVIEQAYIVEGDLRQKVALNIKKKRDMRCYEGIRHVNKLPVRGQRTHTNARTRKGRAIAVAGKKKAT